jgi:hypothetical protein
MWPRRPWSDCGRVEKGRSNPDLQDPTQAACGAGWHPRAGSKHLGVTAVSPAGDRLRAMEQLESRALGKPKERVEEVNEEPEELQAMNAMTPEARRILLRQMNEAEAAALSPTRGASREPAEDTRAAFGVGLTLGRCALLSS